MQWYYLQDGSAQGPVDPLGLAEMLMNNEISTDTLLWAEGMEEWKPFSEVNIGEATVAPSIGTVTREPHLEEPITDSTQQVETREDDGIQQPNSSGLAVLNSRLKAKEKEDGPYTPPNWLQMLLKIPFFGGFIATFVGIILPLVAYVFILPERYLETALGVTLMFFFVGGWNLVLFLAMKVNICTPLIPIPIWAIALGMGLLSIIQFLFY